MGEPPSCAIRKRFFKSDNKKNEKLVFCFSFGAEREGFEPPVPLGTAVFKTAVIDHSTISPKGAAKVRFFFFDLAKKTLGNFYKFPVL